VQDEADKQAAYAHFVEGLRAFSGVMAEGAGGAPRRNDS
jgi:hypothetical protein